MPTGSLSRGLLVLQVLVGWPEGLPLTQIAERAQLPKSGVHRLLANLVEDGFVRQAAPSGNYVLTLRLVSLGLRHLASSTVMQVAKPVLTRLAEQSEQFVRLSLVDGDRLVWVAKAQGARSGLRYEPDAEHGAEVPLGSSASGLAWLSTMNDDEALRLAEHQDLTERRPSGENAPATTDDFLQRLHQARQQGWARVRDSYEQGVTAMAAVVLDAEGQASIGTISVAGPSLLLDDEKLQALLPSLLEAREELTGLTADLLNELQVDPFRTLAEQASWGVA